MSDTERDLRKELVKVYEMLNIALETLVDMQHGKGTLEEKTKLAGLTLLRLEKMFLAS